MNGGLKNIIKAGMLIFALKKTVVGKCDVKESSPSKKEDDAFLSSQIDFKNDWIVDSGSALHITGDVKKLQKFSDYKRPMVLKSDSKVLPIAHVGSTVVSSNSNEKLPLQQVYHIPGFPNLISVSKLTSSGYFVLFGPKDVKLYHGLDIRDEPVMKGRSCLVLVLISSPRQQNGIDKYPEGSKSCASLFSILVVVSCILPNSEDKRVKVLEERVKE
ncbi:hypothetical protein K1719_031394 [Acacia pycnantha]|nr:hypothetical protein K1719_031394 [Acacia pycnantha]